MIVFVSVAAAMVAAALAWILVPLLRGTTGSGVTREASNVAILRDQLKELEADLANGTITREHYDQARAGARPAGARGVEGASQRYVARCRRRRRVDGRNRRRRRCRSLRC